jgi:hypothetical protein
MSAGRYDALLARLTREIEPKRVVTAGYDSRAHMIREARAAIIALEAEVERLEAQVAAVRELLPAEECLCTHEDCKGGTTDCVCSDELRKIIDGDPKASDA